MTSPAAVEMGAWVVVVEVESDSCDSCTSTSAVQAREPFSLASSRTCTFSSVGGGNAMCVSTSARFARSGSRCADGVKGEPFGSRA